MQCSKIENLMSEIIEGTLPAEMEAEVTAHLAQCAACTRDLAALRAILAETAAMEAPELPDGFAERLRARAAERVPVARRSQVLHRLIPAFGAAVMIFMAVAAWQSATWRGESTGERAVAPVTTRSTRQAAPTPQQRWPLESSESRSGVLTAKEKPVDVVSRVSPSPAMPPTAGPAPAPPIDREATAKGTALWDRATAQAPAASAYRDAPTSAAPPTVAGGGAGAGAPAAVYPNRWGSTHDVDATQPTNARTDAAPRAEEQKAGSLATAMPAPAGALPASAGPSTARLRTTRVGGRPGVAVIAATPGSVGARSRAAAAALSAADAAGAEVAREAAPATGLKRVSVSVPGASGSRSYTLFISAAFGQASDENRKIGLQVADVSLDSVLSAMARQNVGFAALVPSPITGKVTVKLETTPDAALAAVFTEAGYRWIRDGQAWALERKEDTGGK